jgi:hypothetical protein
MISNAADGGDNRYNQTATWDMAKVSHLTPQQFSNDMDFTGTVGSNPARIVYMFVGNQGVASAIASTFRFMVLLTYEVEWFNPVPLQ